MLLLDICASSPIRVEDAKHYGEMAEWRFADRVCQMGLHLARPLSERSKYDWIVDVRNRLIRVQVKSTAYVQYGAYRINCISGAHGHPYTGDEFDLLACYIHPEESPRKDGARPVLRPRRKNANAGEAAGIARAPSQIANHKLQITNVGIWYLIPTAAFAPVRQILLSPDGLPRYAKWERYREAWHLLRP